MQRAVHCACFKGDAAKSPLSIEARERERDRLLLSQSDVEEPYKERGRERERKERQPVAGKRRAPWPT